MKMLIQRDLISFFLVVYRYRINVKKIGLFDDKLPGGYLVSFKNT